MSTPAGWQTATLGEMCYPSQYGWTTRASETKGDFRYLRTTDISRGSIDWDSVPFCEELPEDPERYLLKPGDVVISRAGSIGLSALIGECPPSLFASYLIRFRPYEDLSPRYVALYLQSSDYWEQVKAHAVGIALQNVNATKLSRINVPVAPRPEQDRIVAEIEKQFTRLDDAVAALKRVQANLKRYRASVLKAACEGRLVPTEAELARKEGRDYEPASELLKRILAERRARWEADQLQKMIAGGKPPKNEEWKDKYSIPEASNLSNLPKLPEGWTWATWDQVGFSQNGRPFPSKEYSSEGVKLLRPGNLYANGRVEWTESNTRLLPREFEHENPDLVVGPNELVINLTAQSLKDEFLGRVCLTSAREHCLLNQRLARLTPVLLSRRYCLWMFKSEIFRRFVDGLNMGSLIQHMFTSQLVRFVLPVPPLVEQQRIADAIEERLSSLEHLDTACENALAHSSGLRAGTLRAAFSGKLVPQDPNDEPASVLLERIRAERARAQEQKEKTPKATNGASPVNGRRGNKLAQPAKAGKG